MLLLLISFIAGILTVLAPCVLPLLPVIVGGSLAGGAKHKSRPYVIAGSLAASVIIFTLLLKVSTVLGGVSQGTLNWISGGIVVGLGLVSALPEIWERLMVRWSLEPAAQRFLGRSQKQRGKYSGPVLIGLALGPVFASCSPTYAFILASVLPRNFWAGFIYLIAYSVALVLSLLAVALAGRRLFSRLGWAINTHSIFRRALGVLFIVIGIMIIAGWEVKVETWVANRLPFDETRLERTLLSKQHQSLTPKISSQLGQPQKVVNASYFNVQPTPEPEFAGLSDWINSPPLTLQGLRGKVVLVDFWTYSCVNCNRALPYVQKWYNAYKSDGLVVVGVHTPEFAFEHDPANVQKFVKNFGLTYPVALDNDYDTWGAFQNDSWPADYLIDKNGYIRYVGLGEGDYDITESAIQSLLGVNKPLQTPVSNVPITEQQTPETYFGADRQSGFSGNLPSGNATNYYSLLPAAKLSANSWSLGGDWQVYPQYITSVSGNAKLEFNVAAKDVYVVAGASNDQAKTVKVNLPSGAAGQYGPDAPGGTLNVSGAKLYHIAAFSKFTDGVVTLSVPPAVSLYTFTFGS